MISLQNLMGCGPVCKYLHYFGRKLCLLLPARPPPPNLFLFGKMFSPLQCELGGVKGQEVKGVVRAGWLVEEKRVGSFSFPANFPLTRNGVSENVNRLSGSPNKGVHQL